MKQIALIFFFVASICSAMAQAPQFAVVKPNGVTFICPTWDSAYNKAEDDDKIILPSIISDQEIILDKRLHLLGIGNNPDSGMTSFGRINIKGGASGGSIEGINFSGGSNFSQNYSIIFNALDQVVSNFTIRRCRFHTMVSENSNPGQLHENILLTESIFGFLTAQFRNSTISKNIITRYISLIQYSSVTNNIFLWNESLPITIFNSTVSNNIFLRNGGLTYHSNYCGNTFSNNLKLPLATFGFGNDGCTNVYKNSIDAATATDIFITYSGIGSFSFADNYHLKPGCPGINAGTDGTDVGIYGTSMPTPSGWMPGTPQIYYKKVDQNSSADGKLKVEYKVRSGN